MLVKGFKRGEVIELYRKAKVYIDTFLTGQERGVFEAALLNAVPTISNHGPGRSWLDFPLPAVSGGKRSAAATLHTRPLPGTK